VPRPGISWPSPVDGYDVTDVHGLLIWHLMLAWRCVDRRNGLLFYVIALGAVGWLHNSQSGYTADSGLWKSCASGGGQSTCIAYNSEQGTCHQSDYATVKNVCSREDATRAFAVLSFLAAAAATALYAAFAFDKFAMNIAVAAACGVAALFGLICMAIYASLINDLNSAAAPATVGKFGYCFALEIVGWIFAAAAAGLAMMPSKAPQTQ